MPFAEIVGVALAGFRRTMQVGQEHDVIVPMASADAIYHGNSASPNYWWVLVMAEYPRDAAREVRAPPT